VTSELEVAESPPLKSIKPYSYGIGKCRRGLFSLPYFEFDRIFEEIEQFRRHPLHHECPRRRSVSFLPNLPKVIITGYITGHKEQGMTTAQQRATKQYRERRRKRGLQRIEVQVPTGEAAVIRRAAAILRDQAGEAMRLRVHLGFHSELDRAPTALDVFAMDEPLSAEAEALWDEAMAQVERERKDPSLNRPRDVDL